jgi:hypothetical protein
MPRGSFANFKICLGLNLLLLGTYLNNGWLDCLELAEDPLAFKKIYLPKYFQNLSYFICQEKPKITKY